MNARLLVITGALAGTIAGSGIAVAQSTAPIPVQASPAMHLRGERGSARNIIVVRRRLEAMIDQLQRDQRDFGGHREKAVDLLQQARAELNAAIQYDATHPGK